eukprot:INCI51.1.p1 GENE.INCI51.1~~INCI51.1.p1  ORF type:complete len:1362 (+),score=256.52 INCI51.1:419-4087(+)
MCNTGVVEAANSEQLHSILQDLTQMTYFRLIRVNVNGECTLPKHEDESGQPVKIGAHGGEHQADKDKKQGSSGAGVEPNLEQDDEESCGEVIEDEEGETEPACALKGVMESPFASFLSPSPPFPASSSSASPSLSSSSSSAFSSSKAPTPSTSGSRTFQSPLNSFLSEREAQVMQTASDTEDEQQCSANLPEFWLDMCRDFEATTTYNLLLNPEQWTGYNGSAVWQRIYEENCFQDNVGDPMCFEEKVMYRLLSGMHASINIHISKFFYPPSKRKGRLTWSPNPARFMEQYGQKPGKHLQNLHFAFLVLLRAVQKASNYLYYHDYMISGADWPKLDVAESKVEEIKTQQLMRRLLDSGILSSCSQVFSAFDERLMFRDHDGDSKLSTLKRSFKGVFSNISSLLNCVTCHKCRLHGKIQLMGLGAALKILLVPESYVEIALSRDELVALFNTLAKFSAAITYSKELEALFWEEVAVEGRRADESNLQKLRRFQEQATKFGDNSTQSDVEEGDLDVGTAAVVSREEDTEAGRLSNQDAVMLGLESVAVLAASQKPLPAVDEDTVVDQLMDGDLGSLALARTFARRGMHQNFARHVLRRFRQQRSCAGCSDTMPSAAVVAEARRPDTDADVIIVGGGLAGLTAALTIVDAGYRVALLEKQGLFGGNSAWASSGVNGVDVEKVPEDSIEAFTADVVRSSRRPVNDLVTTLTKEATDGLHFLRDRVKFNLSHVGQLGGHSHPRTHRPTEGLVGQEMILAMQRIVKAEAKSGSKMKLLLRSRVQRLLLHDSGRLAAGRGVSGVEYTSTAKGADPDEVKTLTANFVLLATGGYANDHTPADSLLNQYRPDLASLPTTNNKYSTGDGVKLARSAGAQLTDMDQVQVHPTGFIDPKHPDKVVKTLCAEILRGVGAVLLHPRTGRRFVDELGTRDHITNTMLSQNDVPAEPHPGFVVLLNPQSASVADKHVPLYSGKGLLRRFDSLHDVAEGFSLPVTAVAATISEYVDVGQQVLNGRATADQFGKQYFHNLDGWQDHSGSFYAGYVTPVVHYTMGGVTIDSSARVQQAIDDDQRKGSQSTVPGLYAAGEVVGGIHGENRLGGNALTEALVFGRVAAKSIVAELTSHSTQPAVSQRQSADPSTSGTELSVGVKKSGPRIVSREELQAHADDAWVLIGDTVYDFKDFLEEHPAGPEAIEELSGGDGSKQFLAVHTLQVLEDFDDAIVGKIEDV